MKTIGLAGLAIGLVCSCGAGVERCAVERVAAAPVVDGREDACYRRALPLKDFYLAGEGVPAKEQTSARLVHDGTLLYGFVACDESRIRALPRGSERHDDAGIWSSHSLELFFLPKDGVLRHFMVSTEGAVCDAVARSDEAYSWEEDPKWESGMKAAASREGSRWCIEFSVPVKAIGGLGDLSFNLARNRPYGRDGSSWARLDEIGWLPKMNSDAKFGVLTLLDGSFPEDFAANLPPPEGRDKVIRIARAGRVYYDHACPEAVPYLKLRPHNLRRQGVLYLDGANGTLSDIVWNSRHNFPNQDRKAGNRVTLRHSIVFEVPPGVKVEGNAKKTGTTVRDGATLDVYEQPETFAYNTSGWVSSKFSSTLPAGTRGRLWYGVRYPQGKLAMQPIPLAVVNVPKVPVVPKRFMTGHYGLYGLKIADADKWRRQGVNTVAIRGYDKAAAETARQYKAAGFRLRRGDYFWPGGCDGSSYVWQKWTLADETARAFDRTGKAIQQGAGYQLSPAYRGKALTAALEKEVAFMKGLHFDYVSFDMEDYVQKQGDIADFNPATVAAFKAAWTAAHPGAAVPEPSVFEAKPEEHPVEHALWVETKCELWGGFFETVKKALSDGTGDPLKFTEWSMNAYNSLKGRNHCFRGARFFRTFDCFELDVYSGIDRDVRTITRHRDQMRELHPEIPFRFIITPSPVRLGAGNNTADFYYTTAPEVPDEIVCVFKEAATLGARGVYTWTWNLADVEYVRQFAAGVNLVAPVEDIILDGTVRELKTDFGTTDITDKFCGKMQTWKDQPRVFARANTLGRRTLLTVSEYRELKDLTVRVRFPHAGAAVVRDLETGEVLGSFGPGQDVIPVPLAPSRRCRLLLVEE